MQQPVTQYRSAGQAAPLAHGVTPGPHTGWSGEAQLAPGRPPPTHTSQSSQVFSQAGTGVHGGHSAGSPAFSAEHPWPPTSGAPIQTKLPLRAGSSQQPKQSQPLGVSGSQLSTQRWG